MGGQTQPARTTTTAKPAEKDLYPKVRGVSTKRPCEGSPPSGEETWHMRRVPSPGVFYGRYMEHTAVAKTFFLARQEAAIVLQCEPGELTGEML